jgi:hypothetical protein
MITNIHPLAFRSLEDGVFELDPNNEISFAQIFSGLTGWIPQTLLSTQRGIGAKDDRKIALDVTQAGADWALEEIRKGELAGELMMIVTQSWADLQRLYRQAMGSSIRSRQEWVDQKLDDQMKVLSFYIHQQALEEQNTVIEQAVFLACHIVGVCSWQDILAERPEQYAQNREGAWNFWYIKNEEDAWIFTESNDSGRTLLVYRDQNSLEAIELQKQGERWRPIYTYEDEYSGDIKGFEDKYPQEWTLHAIGREILGKPLQLHAQTQAYPYREIFACYPPAPANSWHTGSQTELAGQLGVRGRSRMDEKQLQEALGEYISELPRPQELPERTLCAIDARPSTSTPNSDDPLCGFWTRAATVGAHAYRPDLPAGAHRIGEQVMGSTLVEWIDPFEF